MPVFISIVARTTAFIDLQKRAVESMFTDKVRYVVVNNDHGDARKIINDHCHKADITVHEVPGPCPSNPSESHAHALNWSWRNLVDDVAVFADLDIFPIRPVGIRALLGGKPMAGVPQTRGPFIYPWPGLLPVNIRELPSSENLDFAPVPGRDTGGLIADYLMQQDLGFRTMSLVYEPDGIRSYLPREVADQYDNRFDWQVIDGAWLHYCGGTDWKGNGAAWERDRQVLLNKAVSSMIGDSRPC